jgi:hypothetical protein
VIVDTKHGNDRGLKHERLCNQSAARSATVASCGILVWR